MHPFPKDPEVRIAGLEHRYRCLLLAWVSALLLILGLNVRVFYVRSEVDIAAALTATGFDHVHESTAALLQSMQTLGAACETLGRRPIAQPLPPLALVLEPAGRSTVCDPITPPPTRINGQLVDGVTIFTDTIHRGCQTPEGGNDVTYAVKTVAGEDTHLLITMHQNNPRKPLEIQDGDIVGGPAITYRRLVAAANGHVLTMSNGQAIWSAPGAVMTTR